MGTITGKFHRNPLKTVGVAETRLCLRTDGRTDGWKDGQTEGRTHYYSPLRLTSGDKNCFDLIWIFYEFTHAGDRDRLFQCGKF